MRNILGIVGGGASGLMAAICAKEQSPSLPVVLLEARERVGKKLLATGNGRCNLTNQGGLQGRYHGDTAFAGQVFENFGVEETLSLFDRWGVSPVVLEDGKVYPRSLQASAVLDALRLRSQELGVEVLCGCGVEDIQPVRSGFLLHCTSAREPLRVGAVVVCAGGKASSSLASDGAGYPLLTRLGHTMTSLYPAIVQVRTDTALIRPLKGIKTVARVTACAKGKQRVETGEVLFTEYGLSGPPVLQVSRLLSAAGGGRISLDLIPDWNEKRLAEELERRFHTLAGRTLDQYLIGLLHKRLGECVMKAAGIGPLSRQVSSLTAAERRSLLQGIRDFALDCRGAHSWQSAQVTAGGIRTEEFDPHTLQSKKISGLFAAGEVLNVDGDCGGFNLQWAWSSGRTAGCAAAQSLERPHARSPRRAKR